MPKSAKKRKAKAADFSKAKLKLGKGKQVASNAVDTSFKARSIALPQQSISVLKDDSAPTTRRKQSFDELIVLLKHYNPGTRKDAILGLRELFDAHRELINVSLTTLIGSCVRVIADEDASVRKALLSLLTWLLPLVPFNDLSPHSPLLLLFTTSAQTHIFPEIRVDAVRFLDLLLEHIPNAVVDNWDSGGGHGSRVLEGYLGILNAGTAFGDVEGPVQATSTASVVLTPASKLVVLRSLSVFLLNAITPNKRLNDTIRSSASSSAWYLSSSFSSLESFETFHQLLQPRQSASSTYKTWREDADLVMAEEHSVYDNRLLFPEDHLYSDQPLSDITNLLHQLSSYSEGSNRETELILQLARSLQPTLVSTYLDCAPAVFSPSHSPPETELKLIVAVANITHVLYGKLLQNSSVATGAMLDNLNALLGYMTPYFPFIPSGSRDVKVEQSFQDLNLIYSELSSIRTLFSSRQAETETAPSTRRVGKGKSKGSAVIRTQQNIMASGMQRVSNYVTQLLRGEVAASNSTTSLSGNLAPAAYAALLPTAWSILNNSYATEESSQLLQAIVEHATRTGSKAAVKVHTVEFVGRLVLLDTEPQYRGEFHINRQNETVFKSWIEHLPKTLWELGSSNSETSEVIIKFLLRLNQRRSFLVNEDVLVALMSRLAPFFHITHSTRGALLGPWAKLPSSLRCLSLDVVRTLTKTQTTTNREQLLAAVDRAVASTPEKTYWESTGR